MGKLMDELADKIPSVSRPLLEMRAAAAASGPLSPRERELCMVAALVVLQNRDAIQAHLERAVQLEMGRDELVHAVLTTLGIAAVTSQVVTVIGWIDEWFAARSGQGAG